MVKEKVPSKPIDVPKLFHPDWHSIHPNVQTFKPLKHTDDQTNDKTNSDKQSD